MTGEPDRPHPPAAAPSRAKSPFVVGAAVIAVVSVSALGAWLTRASGPTAPRVAEASTVNKVTAEAATPPTPTATPPAPAATVEAPVTVPAVPPPPAPTSSGIASAGTPPAATPPDPAKPTEWEAMPIGELRAKAEANEIVAMEELARRLVQGVGVTKDPQAGAGWLMRAAQAGSAQSAFNVGVMYERGFVVERDSTRAAEWYRKAIEANLPMAKHNLALLLRDGKGIARNGNEAIELLRSATRQGMAASMFTLGDIYERGDAAPRDLAAALAWFAVAAEFERQTNGGTETPLAKTATQRVQTLQRILTPADLERGQQLGQSEFKQIVEALQPPKPPPAASLPAAANAPDIDPPGWPTAAGEQIRVIQQTLFDLKLLRDKPDGVMGPMTRTAIRTFQRSVGMRETGEPTKDVYAVMKDTLAHRDVVTNSPLPLPAKEPAKSAAGATEPTKTEAAAEPPKVETPAPTAAKTEPGKSEPATADTSKSAAEKPETKPEQQSQPAPTTIDLGKPEAPPPPPTSSDIARADSTAESVASVPDAWPTAAADQVKVIQVLLRELKLYRDEPDGIIGPATRTAIRDYERQAGLKITGDPSKTLFDSLKDKRKAISGASGSTDVARTAPAAEPVASVSDAWPTAAVDQVKVIQVLLRELKLYRDEPDGIIGPATRTAIRDYERQAGLKITGDPSKAVFDSLKDKRKPTPGTSE